MTKVIPPGATFQSRVRLWIVECFGFPIADDQVERNHRFIEEAMELAQACGCSVEDCHQLVDYVYGRPIGEKGQEVGGVMVTLAALCRAWEMSMHEQGEIELARIWKKIEQIRVKQLAKPRMGPLAEKKIPTDAERANKLNEAGVGWQRGPDALQEKIDEREL